MENPIKMDDLGVPLILEKTPISQVNPNLAFIISQFPEEWMFLAKRRFIETWERGRFFWGGKDDLMILQRKMTTFYGWNVVFWLMKHDSLAVVVSMFIYFWMYYLEHRVRFLIFFDKYCSDGWLNHDVVDILLWYQRMPDLCPTVWIFVHWVWLFGLCWSWGA